MKIIRYLAAIAAFVTVAGVYACAQAPADRHFVRKGNRDFKKEEFKEAEIDYRKALVKDSTSFAGNYNLGNTLYKLGDMQQARKCYDKIKDNVQTSEHSGDYWYNLGNASLALEDWKGATEAFMKSLLINPDDMDAKENYVYAREKLREQQNNQNQDQNQDKNENNEDGDGDGGKDKNDGEKKEDSNSDKDGNNDNNGNEPQQPESQQSQGEEQKISSQAAQQILQAIQAKEKETQEKVKKEKAEALKSKQKEKNW